MQHRLFPDIMFQPQCERLHRRFGIVETQALFAGEATDGQRLWNKTIRNGANFSLKGLVLRVIKNDLSARKDRPGKPTSSIIRSLANSTAIF